MDKCTYLQISDQYEKLSGILDEISQLGYQTENCWKTDAGRLFTASFKETQGYIRKVLDQFSSQLSITDTDNKEASDELSGFNF